jgi:uncharacterized membrane protein required for colicin V production
MANIGVLLIIAGCIALLYFKVSFIKSFVTIITAICAAAVAFNYYEVLANILISKALIADWAQTIVLLVLFVLVFAILETIVAFISPKSLGFSSLTEGIGCVVCGFFVGLVVSGVILASLAMAPLPNQYPYPRFDKNNPDVENAAGALLNPDGFVTGLYNVISGGSMSGKRSFGLLHADFLNQSFLNRHSVSDGVKAITNSKAIEVPRKAAAWPAEKKIKNSKGQAVPQKNGHTLTLVRIGITSNGVRAGGTFTPAQLRLVCTKKSDGKGTGVYPIGYIKSNNQLQLKQLSDKITIESADLVDGTRSIDFAFYVPNDLVPRLVEFKQNCVAEIGSVLTADKAPALLSFIQSSDCSTDSAELKAIGSARLYGVELAGAAKFSSELMPEIKTLSAFQKSQTDSSAEPMSAKAKKIDIIRARLEPVKSVKKKQDKEAKPIEEFDLLQVLTVPDGYKLLALKCNNPSAGSSISGNQLPVLVDMEAGVYNPTGIIASGQTDGKVVYEIDYRSMNNEETVAEVFPDNVWLTGEVKKISGFYVLYLVKSDKRTIITSVRPGNATVGAGFKEYEGFMVK